MAQNPVITIEMEDGGIIRAELYPDIAPQYGPQLFKPGAKGVLQRPDLPSGH